MITSGFFDSINNDRLYSAAQMTEYFEGLVSDGVYANFGQSLVVTAGSGMTVNVGTGRAIISCRWLRNDALYPVTINPANTALPRYTAVIVRLDHTARTMSITTKDGTAASTPQYPTMTNTEDVKELCLAMIYVGANATSIMQSVITDKRGTDLCLWVTGLIEQVDTSTLFLQWDDAMRQLYNGIKLGFEAWFDTLTQELSVNTYIQQYRQDVVTTQLNQMITFTQPGYTYSSGDCITVYINGLLAKPTDNYLLRDQPEGSSYFTVTVRTSAGQDVSIIVYKSKIGYNVIGTSDGAALVTSDDEYLDI